jgi:hypothetical protein
MKRNNDKIIEKIIKLTWSSLDSHLEWTYAKELGKGETNTFHRRCVRDYAETMYLVTQLYAIPIGKTRGHVGVFLLCIVIIESQ